MKYKTIVAGTFDFVHKGHMKMLEKALSISNSIVGVTCDELANMNRDRDVNSYKIRRDKVEEYCEELSQKYNNDYKIIKVEDPKGSGSGIMSKDVENIVVSPENKTIERVNNINDMRVAEGLNPLNIKVVDSVYAKDGRRISSTRISKGIIDREGNIIRDKNNFTVINDVHYGFFDNYSLNEKILDSLEKSLKGTSCKDVIVLGDLIHDGLDNPQKVFEEVWSIIDEFSDNCYFTPGNHDVIDLDKQQIENIVGHNLPTKVRINGNPVYIVDSATASNNENIGKISKESFKLLENIEKDSYIVSHFPLEYTSFYQESEFFGEYPEAVFPINKSKLDINYNNVEREIFAHLHMKYSYTNSVDEDTSIPCDILEPFLDIKDVKEKKANITNSTRIY
jgi:pantetheine-phosphate adenylyltransferase